MFKLHVRHAQSEPTNYQNNLNVTALYKNKLHFVDKLSFLYKNTEVWVNPFQRVVGFGAEPQKSAKLFGYIDSLNCVLYERSYFFDKLQIKAKKALK